MISRRGRSRDSVTPFGDSLPSAVMVTTVDVPFRVARTFSMVVATGAAGAPLGGAVPTDSGAGAGRATAVVAGGCASRPAAGRGAELAVASAFGATAAGAAPRASST